MLWLLNFATFSWCISIFAVLILYWSWFWDGARDSTVNGMPDFHKPDYYPGRWKYVKWFAEDLWHACKRMSVYPLHTTFAILLIHPYLWIFLAALIPAFHL